ATAGSQRIPQQHITLLRLAVGHQHIGPFEELRANACQLDETLHFHRFPPFGRGGAQVVLVQDDVAALVVLVGLDDLVPGHLLTGFGIDPLIADGCVVATVQHAEGQVGPALARHERDRHVQQPEGQGAAPDGTGHGGSPWILPGNVQSPCHWTVPCTRARARRGMRVSDLNSLTAMRPADRRVPGVSEIYRIVARRDAESPFSGARCRHGGRWSTPGVHLAYASASPGGALLEYLAHGGGRASTPMVLVCARL